MQITETELYWQPNKTYLLDGLNLEWRVNIEEFTPPFLPGTWIFFVPASEKVFPDFWWIWFLRNLPFFFCFFLLQTMDLPLNAWILFSVPVFLIQLQPFNNLNNQALILCSCAFLPCCSLNLSVFYHFRHLLVRSSQFCT